MRLEALSRRRRRSTIRAGGSARLGGPATRRRRPTPAGAPHGGTRPRRPIGSAKGQGVDRDEAIHGSGFACARQVARPRSGQRLAIGQVRKAAGRRHGLARFMAMLAAPAHRAPRRTRTRAAPLASNTASASPNSSHNSCSAHRTRTSCGEASTACAAKPTAACQAAGANSGRQSIGGRSIRTGRN